MTRADALSWPSVSAIACVSGAAGLAVFFHGDDIRWLVGVQLLLLAWAALVLARSYHAGLSFPLTPLSVSLTLFWLWLAISLSWSRAPATSAINFWWVGTFALVFWVYTLSPLRALLWRYTTVGVLIGALLLCGWALIQFFVHAHPPRASFINIHSFAALLVLVALPAAGYLLIALARGRRLAAIGLVAALALLFFTVALTRGRGTSLALWIGMALLIGLHVRHAARRHLLLLGGLLLGAYLAANALLIGELGERLASLADPAQAASPRLLIWRGAWEMVRDEPWWGIGLGTYYLAWPPYRDPADATLGFYVHNDYLQIWIETGLPGVLLLLGTLLATLAMSMRYLRGSSDPAQRTEAIALGGGLTAIALHSFLDFNLYTMPISLLAGLALARLHELLLRARSATEFVLYPARHLRPVLFRLSVAAALFGPIAHLTMLGISDHYFARGLAHGMQGELQAADSAIRTAHMLAPASNKALAYADLLRLALRAVTEEPTEVRRALYDEAMDWLDQSLRANPYQATAHVVRAALYQEQADLAGTEWQTLAARAYAAALALNPRLYIARQRWAELLEKDGDIAGARALLEAGLVHWYPGTAGAIAYFDTTARLRRATGDLEAAAELDRRVQQMRTTLAEVRLRVPARDAALLQSLAQ